MGRLTPTHPCGKMMARKIIRLCCSLLNFTSNHLLDIILKYSKFQRIRLTFSVWPPYLVILHHVKYCVLRIGPDEIRAVTSDQIVIFYAARDAVFRAVRSHRFPPLWMR
jgi:hypothetical protein